MAKSQPRRLLSEMAWTRKPQLDKDLDIKVFLGPLIHSEGLEVPMIIVPNGVIGVEKGKIIFVDVQENLDKLKDKFSFNSGSIIILGRGEFLIPGFVDTHIHAPQYPNSGLGLDLPLLDWLTKYTFPMESKFRDITFARNVYRKVVKRTLSFGTTTASYFATIHKTASEVLADVVETFGQRALIGKVNMDCYCPESYIETTEASLKSTEEFIEDIMNRKNKLVKPIITPRFALTCSNDLLKGLGDLAKKYDVHVQTHLCESEPEINRAMEIFPDYKSYTEIYKKAGLCSAKSIMAHCVHMTDDQITDLIEASTGVAHCPTSNICLSSGLCPVKKLMQKGLNVGLGTDVSGGYTSSILEAMRHAILTSKIISMSSESDLELTFKDVFYLATLGGAKALNLDGTIGNFKVGKEFDALHIDLVGSESSVDIFEGDTLLEMVQKFIMLGDDRNIVQVYVNGDPLLMNMNY